MPTESTNYYTHRGIKGVERGMGESERGREEKPLLARALLFAFHPILPQNTQTSNSFKRYFQSQIVTFVYQFSITKSCIQM